MKQLLRKILKHLQNNKELQNIDLMNFWLCRNCISKWYAESSREQGDEIDYERVKEIAYAMPYSEWKEKYQNNYLL